MKNLVIPAILAATVLVAGMFAYMPIEKASTVHSTILTKQINASSGDDTSNAAAAVTIVAASNLVKSGRICIKTTDAGADSDADLELAITADLEVVDLLDSLAMEDAGGECVNFTGFRLQLAVGGAADTVDFVAQWSEQQ